MSEDCLGAQTLMLWVRGPWTRARPRRSCVPGRSALSSTLGEASDWRTAAAREASAVSGLFHSSGRELRSLEIRRVVLAPFSLHINPVAVSLQLVKAWRAKRTVVSDDQGGALGTGQGHHDVFSSSRR